MTGLPPFWTVEEARARYQASVVVERPDHILLPGLINTHTHAAMTVFRGLADDMPLEAWLKEAIWPTERRWVSAETRQGWHRAGDQRDAASRDHVL